MKIMFYCVEYKAVARRESDPRKQRVFSSKRVLDSDAPGAGWCSPGDLR